MLSSGSIVFWLSYKKQTVQLEIGISARIVKLYAIKILAAIQKTIKIE